VTYTGVEKAATSGTQSYLLGFTAHNSSRDFSVKLSSEAQAPVGDLTTNLVPTTVDVPPGGSASFALEVRITVCDSGNGLGSGEVSQFRVRADSGPDNVLISPLGGGQFSSLGRLLTGSGVQLALDELAQLKAACQ
jgi:hypothetical protein